MGTKATGKAEKKVVSGIENMGQLMDPPMPAPEKVPVGFDFAADEEAAKLARINSAKRKVRESEKFQTAEEVEEYMKCSEFVRDFIGKKPYGSDGHKVIPRPAASAFRECTSLLKWCIDPKIPGLSMQAREVGDFARMAAKDPSTTPDMEAIFRVAVKRHPKYAYVFAGKIAMALFDVEAYFRFTDANSSKVGTSEAFKLANNEWQSKHIGAFDRYMEMAQKVIDNLPASPSPSQPS